MSVPLPSTFACPQCGQVDQVQKISAVAGEAVYPGQLSPDSGPFDAFLAQRLAPPQEPQSSGTLTPAEVVATIVMVFVALPAFGLAFEAFRETRSLMVVATSDPLTEPLVAMWKIVLFASVVVLVLCLVGFAVTAQQVFA